MGWLETISAPEEYRAAAEGFKLAGLDWVGTMSFDTAGRTMMGMTSEAMVDMVHDLDYGPLAYGANCGTGASDVLRTVLGFASKGMPTPIVSKGNAGIPKYVEGHIHYDGTPELMADYAEMARNCGASIIDHRLIVFRPVGVVTISGGPVDISEGIPKIFSRGII